MFRLASVPLDSAALQRELGDPGAGGFVAFEGRVRRRNGGREIRALEYEAYGELAEKEGARILAEAREKFAIRSARCVHRVGRLQVGEIAVWAGVAAEHRAAAFEACRYIIDEMKRRVPIWKKEHYAGGSGEWIQPPAAGPGHPTPARKA